ncbi:MAG: agmatinase [Euryarchaeota archaeon]|nr:agmatinase [Euryarchaeota archaeon]
MLYTQNTMKFAFSREEIPSKNSEKKYGKVESSQVMGDSKEFGIVGVPFDSTTTYKPGARFGPASIREASYNFERYNIFFNKNLDVPLYDFGNIQVVHGNFKKTSSNIQSTISEITGMSIIPITIGGEHTISFGVLKALDIKNTTIVHLDAHMDLRDSYMEEKYSHATVMRRIFELDPADIVQIGIRSGSYEEVKFAEKNNIKYYTPANVNRDIKGIEKLINSIEGQVYITVDIDVLDPAYAPNVSNPAPGGLNPFQLERLVQCISRKKIIGLDLVEVASTQIGEITSINGAKLIYDFLCLQGN